MKTRDSNTLHSRHLRVQCVFYADRQDVTKVGLMKEARRLAIRNLGLVPQPNLDEATYANSRNQLASWPGLGAISMRPHRSNMLHLPINNE